MVRVEAAHLAVRHWYGHVWRDAAGVVGPGAALTKSAAFGKIEQGGRHAGDLA
jgi:hypothetical protein